MEELKDRIISETNSVSYEVQFYDDLMSMTWEAKEKYLK